MFNISWITEHQAASIVGCSVSKLRQDRHKRRGIPYSKFGKSVRYSTVDLTDYMASKRINPSGGC